MTIIFYYSVADLVPFFCSGSMFEQSLGMEDMVLKIMVSLVCI